MEYTALGEHFSYFSEGEKIQGEHIVLLEQAKDLTKGKSWHPAGFTIQTLFDTELYTRFAKNAETLLKTLWKEAGLSVDDNSALQNYHHLITDHQSHVRAVGKTKLLSTDVFPISIDLLEDRISEICKTKLIAKNPFDQQQVFHFRVIRPGSYDNNPLHRDVWLDDYDNCINLYIPIAGSNEMTSLIIIPGSHLWSESVIERTASGAYINGIHFNVPAVTAIHKEFQVVRPSPDENEVLVFSPYLIHGGAVNTTTNQTRISIEIRLWKS